MNKFIDIETIELTSEILAAYVSNNSVPAAELPGLIRSLHETIGSLGKVSTPAFEVGPTKPAVPVNKSITDDYLISLFDGRKFKYLKRHLMAEHKMNPDEYRGFFGLPKDYPMVAPGYAKQRSSLAKSLDLGRKRDASDVEPEPVTRKTRGRAKKAE